MTNKQGLYLTIFLFCFILVILFAKNFIFYIPKIIILVYLIGFAFIFKIQRKFLNDWFLFLSIVYFSDTLRGLIYWAICKFQFPVYCSYALNLEKAFFKSIPSVKLQQLLLATREIGWTEKFLTALHGTHFIAFLLVGFCLWLRNEHCFEKFKCSFYLLLAGGLSGYFSIPTAPPWLASEMFHLIPPLRHFNLEIYNMYIPDLTSGFNTDPVAAMPSLHAAFPFLCCLLIWKVMKQKGWIFYLYTLLIFFTIIYTGDHYIIDILAGIILASLSFIGGNIIQKNLSKRIINPQHQSQQKNIEHI